MQVAAVRAALDKYADRLDEGLLSNCFAWMKKCQDDRMDTMVTLLQKVLQLYAAKALKGQETEVRRASSHHSVLLGGVICLYGAACSTHFVPLLVTHLVVWNIADCGRAS